MCSGISFIQHFGKSKCRSDNLEEVEGKAYKMQSNARQSTTSRCKYNNTTTIRYYLSLKWMYLALLSSKYIQLSTINSIQREYIVRPGTDAPGVFQLFAFIAMSLLACCIFPCHHLHFISMFFKNCIRSGSPVLSVIRFEPNHTRARPSPLSDHVS